MAPALMVASIVGGLASAAGTAGTLIKALKKPKKQAQLRKDPIDDALPASGGPPVEAFPQISVPRAAPQQIIGGNIAPTVLAQPQQGQPSILAALNQMQNQRIG